MLEISGVADKGKGILQAQQLLESGQALAKFYSICQAQGGFREPQPAPLQHDVLAAASGIISKIDNRKLAKVAKLAGAPKSPGAGILFKAPLGTKVQQGQPLFTIYSETQGELNYALDFFNNANHVIQIDPEK
jgi:thymidine phosphorylase